MPAVEFDLIIREQQYRDALARGEKLTVNFANRVSSETSRIDDSFRKLGQLAGGAFVFTQLAQLPQQIVKVRGEFQQLEIAFTTMLRSKAKADELIGQIKDFALATPYGVKERSFYYSSAPPEGGLLRHYSSISTSADNRVIPVRLRCNGPFKCTTGRSRHSGRPTTAPRLSASPLLA